MNEALFLEHSDWAKGIARSVRRLLPPSFELQDLQQVALIKHWHCVELYDATRGVPYRAYAYAAIQGAVMMSCRRKEYRESTHEELPGFQVVDVREAADVGMLRREERRNVSGPLARRRMTKIRGALPTLAAVDAYLVRRVYLEGGDEVALCALLNIEPKGLAVRLRKAVARLKKEVSR